MNGKKKRGRKPRPAEELMLQYCVKLPAAMKGRCQSIAQRLGQTESMIAREALRIGLAEYERRYTPDVEREAKE